MSDAAIPIGFTFDTIAVGQRAGSDARTITETDHSLFMMLTGGWYPIHSDEIHARAAGAKGRIVHMALSRVSPLAVPVLLDIGRESVRSDHDEDALLAEAEAIIAEATGEPEPPYVPAVLRPNLNRRSSGAQITRTKPRQQDLFS